MAAGAAAGGILGAGANIGAAFISRPTENPGNRVGIGFDPTSQLALQAAQFDALGQIGFADPSLLRSAGPGSRLVNQINGLAIDEKTKRRALIGVQALLSGQRDLAKVAGETQAVLSRLGLNFDQAIEIGTQEQQFQESVRNLGGGGGFQPDVVNNRLQTTANIAEAAKRLSGGESIQFQDRFREQILRDNLRENDRLRETALLRAQFGGFNPGEQLGQLDTLRQDAIVDADLQALEKSLLTLSSAQNFLQPGTAAAQGAAGLGGNQGLGAAGIAANQANATNQIRAQNAQQGAAGLATGISAAGAGLSNTLTTLALLRQAGGSGAVAPAAAGAT